MRITGTLDDDAIDRHNEVYREMHTFGCQNCRVHWRQKVRPTKPVSKCRGPRNGTACNVVYDPLQELPDFLTGKGKYNCSCGHAWTSYNAEFFTPQECDKCGEEVYCSILRPPHEFLFFTCKDCNITWLRDIETLDFFATSKCKECEEKVTVHKHADDVRDPFTKFSCHNCSHEWHQRNVEFFATSDCEKCQRTATSSSKDITRKKPKQGERRSRRPPNKARSERRQGAVWSKEHVSTGSTISTGSTRPILEAAIAGLSLS